MQKSAIFSAVPLANIAQVAARVTAESVQTSANAAATATPQNTEASTGFPGFFENLTEGAKKVYNGVMEKVGDVTNLSPEQISLIKAAAFTLAPTPVQTAVIGAEIYNTVTNESERAAKKAFVKDLAGKATQTLSEVAQKVAESTEQEPVANTQANTRD